MFHRCAVHPHCNIDAVCTHFHLGLDCSCCLLASSSRRFQTIALLLGLHRSLRNIITDKSVAGTWNTHIARVLVCVDAVFLKTAPLPRGVTRKVRSLEKGGGLPHNSPNLPFSCDRHPSTRNNSLGPVQPGRLHRHSAYLGRLLAQAGVSPTWSRMLKRLGLLGRLSPEGLPDLEP